MVYSDCLENSWMKVPGVRIPLPPPEGLCGPFDFCFLWHPARQVGCGLKKQTYEDRSMAEIPGECISAFTMNSDIAVGA